MSQEQQVGIKAKCKGITRLLKVGKQSKYEDVCELLRSSFGVAKFQLQYNDEEGDLVQLGSQVELEEALKVAGKFGPLKVTIITAENPNMNSEEGGQTIHRNTISAEGSQNQLAPEPLSHKQVSITQTKSTARIPDSPSMLTDPIANLQINERPKERVGRSSRQGRKRMGFYASLCNDVANMELGSSESPINECSQQHSKPKKKPKHVTGNKYYSALAKDVAAMNLMDGETSKNVIEKKEKRHKKCKDCDVSHEKMDRKTLQDGIIDGCDVKHSKEQIGRNYLNDDEAPTWFNNAIDKMSSSLSTRVLGALNGAVIASIPTVNGQPVQPVKSVHATYIHDGISCDGCHQVIVGSRYKCGNCPDYDLCEQCEAIEGIHNSSHVFLKLRFPGVGIGRKHSVMIPLLKDIIYKSKNFELAEEQDRRMKDVRKKLKQLAKKKREEQIRLKKGERKMKKFKGSNTPEVSVYELELIFVGDDSYQDGAEVAPESEFTKCWKIRNGGKVVWNDETKLTYLYGAVKSILLEVDLPHLQPGEEGTVSVNFIAPAELGQYFSVWRACHGGKNFGSKLWCDIKVVQEENQSDEDETFVDANEVPPQNITLLPLTEEAVCKTGEENLEIKEAVQEPAQMPREIHQDIVPNFHAYTVLQSTADVCEEPANHDIVPNFHAYTVLESTADVCEEPANHAEESANHAQESTDVDSSPSMVVSELEWDTCMVDNDGEMPGQMNATDYDDLFDIEVISTASSDDFCVVPLPPCFNPDIPLNHESEDLRDSLGSLKEDELHSAAFLECAENIEDSENDDELCKRSLYVYTPPPMKIAHQVAETAIKHGVEDAVTRIDTPTTTSRGVVRRQIVSLPPVQIKTTNVSNSVAPQPLSFERNPFVPGRSPASPPGRAVPVFAARTSPVQADLGTTVTCTSSMPLRHAVVVTCNDNGEHDGPGTVRTQPLVPLSSSVGSSDSTVTSQPRGASITVSVSPAQSTAQYATTFVSGTLASAKRAFGSVSDTVSTFMNGGDEQASVAYNQEKNEVHFSQEPLQQVPPTAVPKTMSKMDCLIEMGFCDRTLNEELLKKYNDDVSKVVTELLHSNDNDWSAGRHASH